MSQDVLYLVLFLVFLALSALFSGTETAFISVEKYRIKSLEQKGVKGAKGVARILERPDRFLSTILLGNNLVNTAAAALATTLAIGIWHSSGIVIATIITTIVLLIFAEVMPKTFANRHAERVALTLVRPVEIISWIFFPIVVVLSWLASVVTKLVGGTPVSRSIVSDEEIRTLISVGHREGTVEKAEAELLDNVFEFGDRPVSEMLVPRPEVIGVEKGKSLSELLSVYSDHPMSRFPIYEENMDNVVGIVSIKDVLMALARGTLSMDSPIDSLIRPAYFTPTTKHISELFAEMRDKNFHMAIVVDEYGGTAGIVSLSRLIEEIVGPVGDELAKAEKDYELINEHTFQIDGGMRIDQANDELGLGLPEGEYETVAGFILHLIGRIPRQGQQIKYKDLKLVITRMKGNKVEEVLLTKEKKDAPPAGQV